MPHAHLQSQERIPRQRPTLTPNNSSRYPSVVPPVEASRYLSPVQEERIRAWRNISATPLATSTPKTKTAKSAPASLSLSQPASSSTCTCRCATSCSCSAKSPRSRSSRQKSYYSGRKMKPGSTLANSAPPMTPMTPLTPAMPTTPTRSYKTSHPVVQRVVAKPGGTGLQEEFPHKPTVPMPEAGVIAPGVNPLPPRIAGVRDPVSQNYFKNMFPPAGAPGVTPGMPMPFVQPGLHMFGMPMGRPWGF